MLEFAFPLRRNGMLFLFIVAQSTVFPVKNRRSDFCPAPAGPRPRRIESPARPGFPFARRRTTGKTVRTEQTVMRRSAQRKSPRGAGSFPFEIGDAPPLTRGKETSQRVGTVYHEEEGGRSVVTEKRRTSSQSVHGLPSGCPRRTLRGRWLRRRGGRTVRCVPFRSRES